MKKSTVLAMSLPGVLAATGVTFDDVYDLRMNEVKHIGTQEAQYLRRGDVLLVRSKSVPDLGDHYIIVTGRPVQKEHGIRPQTVDFPAMQNSPLLDMYDTRGEHVVLLKLNTQATSAFYKHYNIHMDIACNVVINEPLNAIDANQSLTEIVCD